MPAMPKTVANSGGGDAKLAALLARQRAKCEGGAGEPAEPKSKTTSGGGDAKLAALLARQRAKCEGEGAAVCDAEPPAPASTAPVAKAATAAMGAVAPSDDHHEGGGELAGLLARRRARVDSCGDHWSSDCAAQPLADREKSEKRDISFSRGAKVTVVSRSNAERRCTITDVSEDQVRVHFDGFDDFYDEWLPRDSSRILGQPPPMGPDECDSDVAFPAGEGCSEPLVACLRAASAPEVPRTLAPLSEACVAHGPLEPKSPVAAPAECEAHDVQQATRAALAVGSLSSSPAEESEAQESAELQGSSATLRPLRALGDPTCLQSLACSQAEVGEQPQDPTIFEPSSPALRALDNQPYLQPLACTHADVDEQLQDSPIAATPSSHPARALDDRPSPQPLACTQADVDEQPQDSPIAGPSSPPLGALDDRPCPQPLASSRGDVDEQPDPSVARSSSPPPRALGASLALQPSSVCTEADVEERACAALARDAAGLAYPPHTSAPGAPRAPPPEADDEADSIDVFEPPAEAGRPAADAPEGDRGRSGCSMCGARSPSEASLHHNDLTAAGVGSASAAHSASDAGESSSHLSEVSHRTTEAPRGGVIDALVTDATVSGSSSFAQSPCRAQAALPHAAAFCRGADTLPLPCRPAAAETRPIAFAIHTSINQEHQCGLDAAPADGLQADESHALHDRPIISLGNSAASSNAHSFAPSANGRDTAASLSREDLDETLFAWNCTPPPSSSHPSAPSSDGCDTGASLPREELSQTIFAWPAEPSSSTPTSSSAPSAAEASEEELLPPARSAPAPAVQGAPATEATSLAAPAASAPGARKVEVPVETMHKLKPPQLILPYPQQLLCGPPGARASAGDLHRLALAVPTPLREGAARSGQMSPPFPGPGAGSCQSPRLGSCQSPRLGSRAVASPGVAVLAVPAPPGSLGHPMMAAGGGVAVVSGSMPPAVPAGRLVPVAPCLVVPPPPCARPPTLAVRCPVAAGGWQSPAHHPPRQASRHQLPASASTPAVAPPPRSATRALPVEVPVETLAPAGRFEC